MRRCQSNNAAANNSNFRGHTNMGLLLNELKECLPVPANNILE